MGAAAAGALLRHALQLGLSDGGGGGWGGVWAGVRGVVRHQRFWDDGLDHRNCSGAEAGPLVKDPGIPLSPALSPARIRGLLQYLRSLPC